MEPTYKLVIYFAERGSRVEYHNQPLDVCRKWQKWVKSHDIYGENYGYFIRE